MALYSVQTAIFISAVTIYVKSRIGEGEIILHSFFQRGNWFSVKSAMARSFRGQFMRG